MAVDGPLNTVVEVDSVTQPVGPDNPTGNAWKAVPNGARDRDPGPVRSIDQTKARFWKIQSADKASPWGVPTAFKLMPGEHAAPVFGQETGYGPRSGFTTANVWVTKYDPKERFASGEYPNQHPGGDGLPAFVATDENIVGEDIVVWYSIGAHHVVAAGGLAGHAGGPHRVQAEAGGLLRRQPGARPAAEQGPLRATTRPDPQEGSSISGVLLA